MRRDRETSAEVLITCDSFGGGEVNAAVAHLISGILRNFPTDRLRWRFLPWALQLCERNVRERCERRVRTRHGFKMRLDVSDWLGRHVYVTGEYESATTRLFRQRVRAGDTVLDIGANVGYFSCLSATLVGETGRVVSFEPVPRLNAMLQENLVLNGFALENVHAVALSNENAIAQFHVGPMNHSGVSSLRPLGVASESIDVRVARGDDYLNDLDRVDLIKVDVEGAECHVLEGMQGLLERFRPDLVVEITPKYLACMDRTANDMERLLAPLGYYFLAIEHEGLRRLSHLSDHHAPQYNAFFTVDESIARAPSSLAMK